jgi:uncharacterized protein YgiM (DUF1202 family)
LESHQQQLCRVITNYRSAYPDPIVLCMGDEVTIEDRESEWSGWLWCTTKDGKSGWVPADYIRRSGHKGKAARDYDATELTVTKGERLMIIGEICGWYLCRTEDGLPGWVPQQNVEPMR